MESNVAIGQTNSGPRIVFQGMYLADPRKARLVVEGLSGTEVRLRVVQSEHIQSVSGAVLDHDVLRVKLDTVPGQTFVQKEITLTLK